MLKSDIPLLHDSLRTAFAANSLHSTMVYFLHGSILANVDVQPLRPVVHSAHATRLKHAVLLGEILLGKRLSLISTVSPHARHAQGKG
jgi:hypothetical protein